MFPKRIALALTLAGAVVGPAEAGTPRPHPPRLSQPVLDSYYLVGQKADIAKARALASRRVRLNQVPTHMGARLPIPVRPRVR